MGNRGVFIVWICSFLLLYACEPKESKITGQLTLSSKFDFDKGIVSGFHFASQRYVNYPSGGDTKADIVVDQFRLLNGTIKPGFSSPDNNNGFALADQFSSLEESSEFYEDYTQVDTTLNFLPSSDTVRLFQVWILKTSADNYVKLHVRNIQYFEDMSGTYVDVLMDYYYQDDGSSLFP